MADTQYLEDEAEGIGLVRLQQFINLTGAAVSVMLVVGLVLWGYRLAVRDVTGIPVVQALDEPMRIAPVDPGGEIAGNIGLSVNAIAAEGTAPPPAEQLVLAPRPVELSAEDQPVAVLTAPPAPDDAMAVPSTGLADPLAVTDLIVPTVPVEMPTETVLAPQIDPAADMAADVMLDPLTDPGAGTVIDEAPLSDPADDLLPEVIEAAIEPLAEPEPEPAPPGALVRSLRPVARPTEMVVLASLTAPDAEPVAAPVRAGSIAAGTRLVQLGAFDNEADAVAEWGRLTDQFGDLIASKTRVIQDAQSGGRNFVRLRAMGFADEADARRFCSALLSENAACIPVAQR